MEVWEKNMHKYLRDTKIILIYHELVCGTDGKLIYYKKKKCSFITLINIT